MIGDKKLYFSISKKSLRLIKEGTAFLASGGVRDNSGKIIELAKPAVKFAGKSISSPVSLISSVAGNVQAGFIQRSVNQANQKLDLSLDKLDEINDSVNKLLSNSSWNWLGSVVGLANCGISLAGFYVTLEKMDSLEHQINEFTSIYLKNVLTDKLEKTKVFESNIRQDISLLKEYQLREIDERDIVNQMNEVEAFLNRIIMEINTADNTTDKDVLYNIVYRLAIIFAQEIRLFSIIYYYHNGTNHVNFEEWMKVIKLLDSYEFKDKFIKHLLFACTNLAIEQKYVVYESTAYSVEYALGNIAYSQELKEIISEEQYSDFSKEINKKIMKKIEESNYVEAENYIAIEVGG